VSAPPLYVRDGSRFVLYDARSQHVPPIPVPVPVPVEVEGPVEDPANPYRTILPRPPTCEHGSFRGCRVRRCPGPR
jgi:hypothetical protein